MSDGQRSGRSTGRVSCKRTELKRCSMIEMRWNKYEIIIIIIIIIKLWQVHCAFSRVSTLLQEQIPRVFPAQYLSFP